MELKIILDVQPELLAVLRQFADGINLGHVLNASIRPSPAPPAPPTAAVPAPPSEPEVLPSVEATVLPAPQAVIKKDGTAKIVRPQHKPGSWVTEARKEIMIAHFDTPLPPQEFLVLLRASPGPEIKNWDQVYTHAKKQMGLRRHVEAPASTKEMVAAAAEASAAPLSHPDVVSSWREPEVVQPAPEPEVPPPTPAVKSDTPWIVPELEAREADFEAIQAWAADRHIHMRSAVDLPAVNLKARQLGLRPFVIRPRTWTSKLENVE